ncbi:death on curing protein [Shimia gijangensis]|uniref:Death on curing protein n=1 Tax=Shimia gijangensis TaxID=1470563 RepID=A0A1M6TN44_9RHOB|nr:type II toxin-antitoxin system death-on-curing family toxin [Shimia gijangensis]SHK58415.1 death on curing protein [Shimia gijangensis]
MFRLLSSDLVDLIHENVLNPGELQGRAGDKSLEGALSRVDNRLAFGMVEDGFSLAAFYAEAIVQGHCFNDGNKRTAHLSMDVCLDLNGIAIKWVTEDVADRIILLAQGKLEAEAFAYWLRTLPNPLK